MNGDDKKARSINDRVDQQFANDPLPPAIPKGKWALSDAGRHRVKELTYRAPTRLTCQIILAWLTIALAFLVACLANNWFVTLCVIALIATRQNALGLCVHEQVHYLGFKSRRGELFVNVFAAFPLGISVNGYGGVHLAHHGKFFTDDDPDYLRKRGKDWQLPKPVMSLLRLFAADLLALRIFAALRAKHTAAISRFSRRPIATPGWIRFAYYGTMVGVITWFQLWSIVLLYWMLPLATVLQALIRFLAMCEHLYNLENPKLEEATPLIIPHWWERLLFPTMSFTYHIYHHWFPGVPCHNLPKVHAIFESEGLVDHRNIFYGFDSFIRCLLVRSQVQSAG